MSAEATLTSGGLALANEPVSFSLNGTDNCSGTTDALGNVSCFLTPSEMAGTYSITASFAGDADHLPASDTTQFIVTLEETTTTLHRAAEHPERHQRRPLGTTPRGPHQRHRQSEPDSDAW